MSAPLNTAPSGPSEPRAADAALAQAMGHTRAREVLDCVGGVAYLLQDLPVWMRPGASSPEDEFLHRWATRQEFRSLMRYRVSCWADAAISKSFAQFTAGKPWMFVQNLYLSCKDIGPGFYIEHGFSSIVFARKVGSHFRLNQNVTVGGGTGGIPLIGDHVSIYTGAVVIGGITVGDHVRIGANAVVLTDVPALCTVVPAKCRVIQRTEPNDDVGVPQDEQEEEEEGGEPESLEG